jgi:hypothetical protein
MAQLQLLLKVRTSEGIKQKQPVNTLEKHNDSVGGWSSESIKQCNFLRKLVKTGREADKNCEDEPKRMEMLLMDFCRTMVGIKDPQDDENLDGAGDGSHNNAAARANAMETVEADWDSDED